MRRRGDPRLDRAQRRGATAPFVSHSIEQIREMCSRVLWLEHGKMKAIGLANEVRDAYAG